MYPHRPRCFHVGVKSHKWPKPFFPKSTSIFVPPKISLPIFPQNCRTLALIRLLLPLLQRLATLLSRRQPLFISSSTSDVPLSLPSTSSAIFYSSSTSSTSDEGSISRYPSPLVHLLLPLPPVAADTALLPVAILHFFFHFRRRSLPPFYEPRHFLSAIDFIDVRRMPYPPSFIRS
ncbi:hypothetical protein ACLOJK_001251 [Asimina triloba]